MSLASDSSDDESHVATLTRLPGSPAAPHAALAVDTKVAQSDEANDQSPRGPVPEMGLRLKLYENGAIEPKPGRLYIMQDRSIRWDIQKLALAKALGAAPADHPITRRMSFAASLIKIYLLPTGELVENAYHLRQDDCLAIDHNERSFHFPATPLGVHAANFPSTSSNGRSHGSIDADDAGARKIGYKGGGDPMSFSLKMGQMGSGTLEAGGSFRDADGSSSSMTPKKLSSHSMRSDTGTASPQMESNPRGEVTGGSNLFKERALEIQRLIHEQRDSPSGSRTPNAAELRHAPYRRSNTSQMLLPSAPNAGRARLLEQATRGATKLTKHHSNRMLIDSPKSSAQSSPFRQSRSLAAGRDTSKLGEGEFQGTGKKDPFGSQLLLHRAVSAFTMGNKDTKLQRAPKKDEPAPSPKRTSSSFKMKSASVAPTKGDDSPTLTKTGSGGPGDGRFLKRRGSLNPAAMINSIFAGGSKKDNGDEKKMESIQSSPPQAGEQESKQTGSDNDNKKGSKKKKRKSTAGQENGSSDRTTSKKDMSQELKGLDKGMTIEKYIENICDVYSYAQNRPDEDTRHRFVCMPESKVMISWQLVILVITVFYLIKTPWKICFDTTWGPTITQECSVDITFDIVFMVDICINFVTAYPDKEKKEMVFDHVRIAKQYMRKWFWLDVIASLPFSISECTGGNTGVGSSTKLLRLLRIFKILRLLKLLRYINVFQDIVAIIQFNPSLVRFAKLLVILVVAWHYIGSFYWLIMVESTYRGIEPCTCANGTGVDVTGKSLYNELNKTIACGRPTIADGGSYDHYYRMEDQTLCYTLDCVWYGVEAEAAGDCDRDAFVDPEASARGQVDEAEGAIVGLYPNRWVQHPIYADAKLRNFWAQWLQALFWAVEVTTGIGDDISPKTIDEVLFTSVTTVIGLLMYSIIIGSASSALQNMDSAGAERRRTLDKVTDYLRFRKVPQFFQKIIVEYYEHLWTNVGDRESSFLDDLPPTLRVRLMLILNKDLVTKVPIFQTFTAEVLIRLIQRLVTETYLPGEYIVKAGDTGDSMHFIKSGKVDIIAPDERTLIVTLKQGNYFGERALVAPDDQPSTRNATIRAVDYCELLILLKSDFVELRQESEDMAAVQEFTRKLQETIAARDADLARKTAPKPRKNSSSFLAGIMPQTLRKLSISSQKSDSDLALRPRGQSDPASPRKLDSPRKSSPTHVESVEETVVTDHDDLIPGVVSVQSSGRHSPA